MAWYATGVAAVGVVSSIVGGSAAKKAAASAAKAQAKLTFRQRQEEIRMKQASAAQQKGAAVATVYASNLQMSGSSARYVNAMNVENMREIAFAVDAARLEKRAIQKGAAGAGASLFANAGQQLGQIAGLMASKFLAPTTPTINTSTQSGFYSAGAAGQLSYTDTPGGMSA